MADEPDLGGPLPEIHPRELLTHQARIEFAAFLGELCEKHKLTYAEMFQLLGAEITSLAKYAIQAERHPKESDKPGGAK